MLLITQANPVINHPVYGLLISAFQVAKLFRPKSVIACVVALQSQPVAVDIISAEQSC